MEVKRYMVFAYPSYYPGGGWSDFVCSMQSNVQTLSWSLMTAELR